MSDFDRLDRFFARYVDDGRLAGWQLAVTQRGKVIHDAAYGFRDREAAAPVTDDTLWRIYSMTKPIATVAAMSLWQEGAFQLTDPVSDWLPSFADLRVYQRGSANDVVTVPAAEPIRVWHLLSHTAGITAGWMRNSVVDELYRRAGYEVGIRPGTTLASLCDDIAGLPLLFQPGTAWGYGMSTDVLGRLIELWSGQSLDVAIAERVTRPLGMTDTVWHTEDTDRLAALYTAGDGRLDGPLTPPRILSAGGGMLSTLPDYVRFTQMLVGGGELDGVRVLAPRTVRLMTANHLDGDLKAWSAGGFTNTDFAGIGFGLGFAVVVDPVRSHSPASPGEFYWGGAAGTVFWVDPAEDLTVVFMTQLLNMTGGQLVAGDALPIRARLRQLVYSAVT
jgi:CubicO group peptidase (beta-lactamase class C family)